MLRIQNIFVGTSRVFRTYVCQKSTYELQLVIDKYVSLNLDWCSMVTNVKNHSEVYLNTISVLLAVCMRYLLSSFSFCAFLFTEKWTYAFQIKRKKIWMKAHLLISFSINIYSHTSKTSMSTFSEREHAWKLIIEVIFFEKPNHGGRVNQ